LASAKGEAAIAQTSTFQGETGLGFGVAHRLPAAVPLDLIAGYGNGGGNQHTGYVGLGGEFLAGA
jgi:trimeric autotransporter adhesin